MNVLYEALVLEKNVMGWFENCISLNALPLPIPSLPLSSSHNYTHDAAPFKAILFNYCSSYHHINKHVLLFLFLLLFFFFF